MIFFILVIFIFITYSIFGVYIIFWKWAPFLNLISSGTPKLDLWECAVSQIYFLIASEAASLLRVLNKRLIL